jgi:hypothetical protein
MLSISPASFRAVVLTTLLTLVISVLTVELGLIAFDPEVETARSWAYYDSVLPFEAIQVWYSLWAFATVSGLAGSMFFWRPARWLLAGAVLLTIATQPFLGLVTASAFEMFLGGIAGTLTVWIVAVSFWSPLAAKFAGNTARVP